MSWNGGPFNGYPNGYGSARNRQPPPPSSGWRQDQPYDQQPYPQSVGRPQHFQGRDRAPPQDFLFQQDPSDTRFHTGPYPGSVDLSLDDSPISESGSRQHGHSGYTPPPDRVYLDDRRYPSHEQWSSSEDSRRYSSNTGYDTSSMQTRDTAPSSHGSSSHHSPSGSLPCLFHWKSDGFRTNDFDEWLDHHDSHFPLDYDRGPDRYDRYQLNYGPMPYHWQCGYQNCVHDNRRAP